MFNEMSFSALITFAIKNSGAITPQNIESLSNELTDLSKKFGQYIYMQNNLFLPEPVMARTESHEDRTTFRGTFSDSSKGTKMLPKGWVNTGTELVSEKNSEYSLFWSSYRSHDVFGDRSESHAYWQYLPKEAGQLFNSPFSICSGNILSIKKNSGGWNICIPAEGIEDCVFYLYDEVVEIPEFTSYPEAFAWAMDNNYQNTAWGTNRYMVIRSTKEDLPKVLFYADQKKWKKNDGWLFEKQEEKSLPEIYVLEETIYPSRVEREVRDLWFCYLGKRSISSTGWGWCKTETSSEDLEEIMLPGKVFPKTYFEVKTSERELEIHTGFALKNKGDYISFVDGKFVWGEILQNWNKAIIIESQFGSQTIVLFEDKDNWIFLTLERILKGRDLYPWMLKYKDAMLSIFDLQFGSLKSAVQKLYIEREAKIYGSEITSDTRYYDVCKTEEEQLSALLMA